MRTKQMLTRKLPLFFYNLPSFLASLVKSCNDPPPKDQWRKEQESGKDQKTDGDGAFQEDQETPMGHDQRLTQRVFKHRPNHQGKDHRSTFIIHFLNRVPQDAKNGHNDNIRKIVIEAIRSNQAEQKDHREEKWIRDLEHPHPQGNQGKV